MLSSSGGDSTSGGEDGGEDGDLVENLATGLLEMDGLPSISL